MEVEAQEFVIWTDKILGQTELHVIVLPELRWISVHITDSVPLYTVAVNPRGCGKGYMQSNIIVSPSSAFASFSPS